MNAVNNKNIDLSIYGITEVSAIFHNLSYEDLFQMLKSVGATPVEVAQILKSKENISLTQSINIMEKSGIWNNLKKNNEDFNNLFWSEQ